MNQLMAVNRQIEAYLHQPTRSEQGKNSSVRTIIHLSLTLTAASTARMYEFTPNPIIWPRQTGAMSDLCRNSSLAWTFERWISIVGMPTAAIASRNATLVWV